MRPQTKILLLLFLATLFSVPPARSCQYNVLETGFVDMGRQRYTLYVYHQQSTPLQTLDAIRSAANIQFAHSNIVVEMISIDGQGSRPALKYLERWPGSTLPTAILVSSEGRSMPIELNKPGSSLQKVFSRIVSSPAREEILRAVSKNYGAVLMIEGRDRQINRKARASALAAIDNIRRKMVFMPKAIKHPPVLVTVSAQQAEREKILLWSLGLTGRRPDTACAAIVYGRARWLGPLLRGEEITEENLVSIMRIIGADCECGLDKRWLQGSMLPARWDDQLLARIVKNFNLDPENPIVKAEISRIMRMPLAYGRNGNSSAKSSSTGPMAIPAAESARGAAISLQDSSYVLSPNMRPVLISTIAFLLIVLATGLILWLKFRNR